jgi:hypothetical protein
MRARERCGIGLDQKIITIQAHFRRPVQASSLIRGKSTHSSKMARFILCIVIGIALLVRPSFALAEPAVDQIRVVYGEPKNPDHRPIYDWLKGQKVLERFKELLSPLKLPRPLVFEVQGCDGVENAWYGDDTITVCYEYLEGIRRNVPKETTPAGVTPRDALIGPTMEVFLHEFAHAAFDYLKLPIFGREEDAADQFVAYVLLSFGKDARRLVGGLAYMFQREAEAHAPAGKDFANEHGTPAQRFYNLLCQAYGFNPDLFGDVVAKGYLPKDRADGCSDEYQQVNFAIRTLIWPYIDQERLALVRGKPWLDFDDALLAPSGQAADPPASGSAGPRSSKTHR